jgi:hypothetical protein
MLERTFHIGGNAALMGIQMTSLGTDVLLGGSLGVESKKILPVRSMLSLLFFSMLILRFLYAEQRRFEADSQSGM